MYTVNQKKTDPTPVCNNFVKCAAISIFFSLLQEKCANAAGYHNIHRTLTVSLHYFVNCSHQNCNCKTLHLSSFDCVVSSLRNLRLRDFIDLTAQPLIRSIKTFGLPFDNSIITERSTVKQRLIDVFDICGCKVGCKL